MPPNNRLRAKPYAKAGKQRKDKKASTSPDELLLPPPSSSLPSSSSSSLIALPANKTTTTATTKTKSKYHHCYLLQSKINKHKTYIGYTTNPERRLKQHNGLIQGGAAQTSKNGGLYRPWEFVCVVGGFENERDGLKFEWAWQHPNKSTIFRSGFDTASSATTAATNDTTSSASSSTSSSANTENETNNSNQHANNKNKSNSALVASNKALVDMVLKSSGKIGGLRRQLTILMILLCESDDYRTQNLTVNFIKSNNSNNNNNTNNNNNNADDDSSIESNDRNSNEMLFRELFNPCRGNDDLDNKDEDNEFANWCKSLPPQMKCWTIPSLGVMPFAMKNKKHKNDKSRMKKRKRKEDIITNEKNDSNLSSTDNSRICNSTKCLLEGRLDIDGNIEHNQDHGMDTNHDDNDDDKSLDSLLASSDDNDIDDNDDDYNYNSNCYHHFNQAQVLHDIQNLSLVGEEDEESIRSLQLKGNKKIEQDHWNKKKKVSKKKRKVCSNYTKGIRRGISNSNDNNVIDLLESSSSDSDELDHENEDNTRGTGIDATTASANIQTNRDILAQLTSSCNSNSINDSINDSISTSTIDLMSTNFEQQHHGTKSEPNLTSNSNHASLAPPMDTIDLTSPSSTEQNNFSYDSDSDSDNTIDLYSTSKNS